MRGGSAGLPQHSSSPTTGTEERGGPAVVLAGRGMCPAAEAAATGWESSRHLSQPDGAGTKPRQQLLRPLPADKQNSPEMAPGVLKNTLTRPLPCLLLH